MMRVGERIHKECVLVAEKTKTECESKKELRREVACCLSDFLFNGHTNLFAKVM